MGEREGGAEGGASKWLAIQRRRGVEGKGKDKREKGYWSNKMSYFFLNQSEDPGRRGAVCEERGEGGGGAAGRWVERGWEGGRTIGSGRGGRW